MGFERGAGLALCLALSACAPSPLTGLERTLAADNSATAALTRWCGARHLADPARITATQLTGSVPPPADARKLLGAEADEPLGYRHVAMACGGTVLSEAHNWYRPARLTPAMNATLARTDTPFGSVVAPLGFHRERLAAQRGRGEPCPAGTVLTHRALLRTADGEGLALVIECYTAANLQ